MRHWFRDASTFSISESSLTFDLSSANTPIGHSLPADANIVPISASLPEHTLLSRQYYHKYWRYACHSFAYTSIMHLWTLAVTTEGLDFDTENFALLRHSHISLHYWWYSASEHTESQLNAFWSSYHAFHSVYNLFNTSLVLPQVNILHFH